MLRYHNKYIGITVLFVYDHIKKIRPCSEKMNGVIFLVSLKEQFLCRTNRFHFVMEIIFCSLAHFFSPGFASVLYRLLRPCSFMLHGIHELVTSGVITKKFIYYNGFYSTVTVYSMDLIKLYATVVLAKGVSHVGTCLHTHMLFTRIPVVLACLSGVKNSSANFYLCTAKRAC